MAVNSPSASVTLGSTDAVLFNGLRPEMITETVMFEAVEEILDLAKEALQYL